MIILISPTKTMAVKTLNPNSLKSNLTTNVSTLINRELTHSLRNTLNSLNDLELKRLYKSSDAIVQTGKKLNQMTEYFQSIELFQGAVFKNLEYQSLDTNEQTYINNRVYIFSALYGLIPSSANIQPYRLDLNNQLEDKITGLTQLWKPFVNTYLADKNPNIILDLASSEYRKLLNYSLLNELGINVITIDFKDYKNDKYITLGTYAKMARGQYLRALAKNNAKTLKSLKSISVMNYTYNQKLSSSQHYIFTR